MWDSEFKAKVVSISATLIGCLVIFGSMALSLSFPRVHLGVLIALGALLGAPLIVLGMRLHPDTARSEAVAEKPFFPNSAELRSLFWNSIAVLTLLACMSPAIAYIAALYFAVPEGDSWLLALVRVSLVTLGIGGFYLWLQYVKRSFAVWFRGRVSDQVLESFVTSSPQEEPKGVLRSLMVNWQLITLIVLAAFFGLGLIDLNHPLLKIELSGRRLRGFAVILAWMRGNPNTVLTSSWLIMIGAFGLIAYRVQRARL